jgi:hypothetical protein
MVSIATKGYELYTRDKLLSGLSSLAPVGGNKATPYANIIVAVFLTRPAALAAYARAPRGKASLPELSESGALQAPTPRVIRHVKPYVEQLAAAQSALKEAGLLP